MECPICGCDGAYMGTLGDLDWYRCPRCGLDFSDDDKRLFGPSGEENDESDTNL